ncbi:MAG: carbohydrate binding family 9 domain-containing protein [Gemmatimonadetes bacterium]|nr:carbohydrate binding family 9 domain-containing protein [Gemmatimonadota bacterium]
MRIDEGPGQSARGVGVRVALVMGLVLISMPGNVAGQAQGADEPTSPEGQVLEDRVLEDQNLEDGSSEDRALEDSGLVAGRPTVRPTRIDTPPVIDGRLDEEVWKTAALLTEFVQQSPLDGAPATEKTEVYIAYDSEKIYLGFYAHYEEPSIMRANRVDRDRAAMDDLLTVYFDTFMDQQRGYGFDVNAYGVQGDGIITAGGGHRGGPIPRADRSWNTLFETGGQIVEDGFTAEMAIPFKSLRYPSRARDEPHRWGFQIVREVRGKNQENQVWAPMSRDESSFFAQMGVLEGMTNLSTSRNLEVLPTFTAIEHGAIDPTVPGYAHQATDPDAGVSIKYGITSNLTADFTVNPDFSQIESDRAQIEVNQRYPLFFPELRPFFVEGAEMFDVPGPVTFVHTRTIVNPQYGAKLTGKLGAMSVGVLAANDVAPGDLPDELDPAFGKSAQTFIGRVRYDLYPESNIGVIFTDREFMDGFSRLLGADGNFRLSPTIAGAFRGVGAWNLAPDGVEKRNGHVYDASLRKNGRHVNWFAAAYEISPNFDTDVGFVRRTDERRLSGNIGYRFWPQGRIINWGPRFTLRRNWDFDGALQDERLGFGLNFSLAGNIRLGGSYDREMERFLGVDFEKRRYSVNANVNASRRFSFGLNFKVGDQIRYTVDPLLGDQFGWSLFAQVRPTTSLSTRLNLSGTRLTIDGVEDFDVKILRASTTYQITPKFGIRNITQFNSLSRKLDFNLLATFRINAGTVFFLGYDDHYQQADFIVGDGDGDGLEEQLFYRGELQRTNRAIFVKLQYLLRY